MKTSRATSLRKDAEIACAAAVTLDQTSRARLALRGLGPGTYPVYLSGTDESEIELRVAFEEPRDAPENETCGSASPLEPGARVTARLASAARDVPSACVLR